MTPRHRQHAFTLAEILVAIVFLAVLIPAVLQGLNLSTRASLLAERGTLAVHLAQNKLDELTLNDDADMSGDFGEDHPGYRWETERAPWAIDNKMEELTLRAFFTVQGREESISLTTLVSGTTR